MESRFENFLICTFLLMQLIHDLSLCLLYGVASERLSSVLCQAAFENDCFIILDLEAALESRPFLISYVFVYNRPY